MYQTLTPSARVCIAVSFIAAWALPIFASENASQQITAAKKAWSEYQAHRKSFSISFSDHVVAGTYEHFWNAQFVRSGDSSVYIEQYEVLKDKSIIDEYGYVYGHNDLYEFRLSRKSKTTPWVVESLAALESKVRDAEVLTILSELRIRCEFSGHCLNKASLLAVLSDRRCTILSANDEDLLGKRATKVSVAFSPPSDVNSLPSEVKGWRFIKGATFWLDPDNEWSLMRASVIRTDGAKESVNYEQMGHVKGFSFPKESTTDRVNKEDSKTVTKVSDLVIDGPIDERQFRLTAYGLPEPDIGRYGFKGMLAWVLSIGAVALIAIGLYLKKIKRSFSK